GARVRLDTEAESRLQSSADAVAAIVESGVTVYGINTGFGVLAQTHIEPDKLAELQSNLVHSHACGLGQPLPDRVVRLILALKAIGLARGYSGVRPVIVATLLDLLNADLLPLIPAQGSVGASGDLAPLAHLSLTLLGEGNVRSGDVELSAAEALSRIGREPMTLAPKEGLALVNGTQVSTALALAALFDAETVLGSSLVTGALAVDAARASDAPFDPRIHELRGHAGQIRVAACLRTLLEGSAIRASHERCHKVQDPYSYRCQPQVAGAALDLIETAAATLTIEANAVTDNPLVFADTGEAVSGGNFHAEPVAFAADILTMALCEIGSLAERRVAVLVDANMSGLPAFLVEEGGLNSGFMIAQVSAAALVAENRSLAFPASVDSIPTSANQEDHVSMAPGAARKALTVARNVAGIVGIEWLAAAQGIDFHAPLTTSGRLARAHAALRRQVPFLDHDRYLAAPHLARREFQVAGQ
ncbi:MAG: histidine ammonia-lyase, partial [Pseudomonadota bacterium]